MEFLSAALVVVGLSLFEGVSSLDNAIINAEVLRTMGAKARRWFLLWGILFAVFVVRGVLPWLILYAVSPDLGFWGSFTATFSSDPRAVEAIERASPILLMGGGLFLVFLFFHWLFLEPKQVGLSGERFFMRQGVWFYAVVSLLLSLTVWFAMKRSPMIAFGAVVGSTAFFITHGFKQNAELAEREILNGKSPMSDIAKILYLEIIDMTFSIDGVLGAFAFTMSIPLILLGNGLGAIMVRQFTVGNIERLKKYVYLKNGAMYSILVLGTIMMLHGFGWHVPEWLSPTVTILIIGAFWRKSVRSIRAASSPN